MSLRDPRKTPRVGDIVSGGKDIEVISTGKHVSWRLVKDKRFRGTIPISEWRTWAATAAVIRKA